MKDVARLAGVSVATVSAVLNSREWVRPVVAQRVKEAMESLDYRPDYVARSLRSKRTNTIGMVITDNASAFFAEMARGVQDAARKARYSFILCNSDEESEEEERHLITLYSWRVDGIILATTYQHGAQIPRSRRPCPIVLVDRALPGYKADMVVIDNVAAAYKATKHLIELGHTRIGIITGPARIPTARDREEGFRKAMQDAHLELPQQFVKCGGFRMEGGYHSALELMRMPGRPTAIFSWNYLMTVGLMRALNETGIPCPQELSIVGFDDFDTGLDGFSLASLFCPKLTTIRQPAYEIGKRAFEMLLQRMTRPEKAPDSGARETLILDAALIIRNSTAPPPKERGSL
jgi:LacI family transcriptional regulator